MGTPSRPSLWATIACIFFAVPLLKRRLALEARAIRRIHSLPPEGLLELSLRAEFRGPSPACARMEDLVITSKGAALSADHAGALRCLAGKSLVFIGDSVTRYQYLSMVHFLDRGRFPPRCTRGHDKRAGRSVVREADFPSWPAFHNLTEGLVGGVRGREVCDCDVNGTLRRPDLPPLNPEPPHWCGTENRFYSQPAGPFGKALEVHFITNVHCIFGFAVKWKPSAKRTPHSGPANLSRAARLCDPCFAARMPSGGADIIVLNAGFWVGAQTSRRGLKDFMRMSLAHLKPHGRLVWRTTNWPAPHFWLNITGVVTHQAAGFESNRLAKEVALDLGAHVLDVEPLFLSIQNETGFRWDWVHFEPAMYEAFNSMLLRWTCGDSPRARPLHTR